MTHLVNVIIYYIFPQFDCRKMHFDYLYLLIEIIKVTITLINSIHIFQKQLKPAQYSIKERLLSVVKI